MTYHHSCETYKARRHEGDDLEFEPLSREVIGAAIEVHRRLGPGLLESVYQRCLAIELEYRGIPSRQEVPVPLAYRGQTFADSYRIDLVVDDSVIVEVKSVQRLERVHQAQLLTYLRLTRIRTGLLFNFNTAVLRHGILRMRL
ncbi:GxxExxY protein [Pseudogemmatithrix spongiicola]|uniref:GxxExxY protein n=2 Tax=Pseudogemmatithrix spongiicola TaxID=3062599 RepID=A0AA49JSA7_9BACT|nr:GxxExxY protein [Gemmatimonadaceae bacterium 'strain 138']WKW13925.1 GxxExxY protein [Gemmatimonadaceae bacterium 'strain 318']